MMAITRAPAKPTLEAAPAAREDRFISGAPDAQSQATGRGIRKGKKEQITITVAPEILDRVDEARHKMGLSRAAWINTCIFQGLESGFTGIRGSRDE